MNTKHRSQKSSIVSDDGGNDLTVISCLLLWLQHRRSPWWAVIHERPWEPRHPPRRPGEPQRSHPALSMLQRFLHFPSKLLRRCSRARGGRLHPTHHWANTTLLLSLICPWSAPSWSRRQRIQLWTAEVFWNLNPQQPFPELPVFGPPVSTADSLFLYTFRSNTLVKAENDSVQTPNSICGLLIGWAAPSQQQLLLDEPFTSRHLWKAKLVFKGWTPPWAKFRKVRGCWFASLWTCPGGSLNGGFNRYQKDRRQR